LSLIKNKLKLMHQTIYILLSIFLFSFCTTTVEKEEIANYTIDENLILFHKIDPQKQELQFFWKDKTGKSYRNFENLRNSLQAENKNLVFAMNGGMFNKDQSPQGLYIDNGITKAPIDTKKEGYGNFYLQPNGIFALTNAYEPIICTTDKFKNQNIKYATQSGPMLVIDGTIHSKLTKGSSNLNIRNGVGILPNGHLLFAMSKNKINFYDFATFFKQKGCKNALYLDGYVSKTYLPSKNWEQIDGNFGVIIAEIK